MWREIPDLPAEIHDFESMKFDVVCENHLQFFCLNGTMVPHYVTEKMVYAIDSAGVLYKVPRVKKGASDYFNAEEFAVVDYNGANDNDGELIRDINQFLIKESEKNQRYYEAVVKRRKSKKK